MNKNNKKTKKKKKKKKKKRKKRRRRRRYIENNRLVPWMEKVYLALLRNLFGSPSAHPINSSASPDKLSPSTAPIYYSIYPVIVFFKEFY
jgi:hypothetical protein